MHHFNESNQENQPQMFGIQEKISDIYADIEGELCSKQSTLFNRLKNQFASLYSGLLPSNFVIVNHVVSLSQNVFAKTLLGRDITMATQNGVILLVKQTYLGEKIFINGLCGEEMTFQAKGSIFAQQNQNFEHSNCDADMEKLQKDISSVIQLANDSLALNKLLGGTILVYSNISDTVKFYRQKILLSIFMSVLLINSQLKSISMNEIYQKLQQSALFSSQFLNKQFKPYAKRQLIVEQMSNGNVEIDFVDLNKKDKLLFFDIGLDQKKLKAINSKRQNIKLGLQKNIIKQHFAKNLSISQNSIQQIKQQILSYKQGNINTAQLLESFNNFSNSQQGINIQFLPQQLKQQAIHISKLIGKQNKFFIVDNLLIFCVGSYQVHENIRLLRKYISDRISTQQQNPQIFEKRFGNHKGIEKRIFSCAPSMAIAILNPQKEMWFK